MFCGKCGAKNESNAKFCEKCGAKLEKTHSPQENKNIKKIKDRFHAFPKKIKIGIGLALIVVIAAIIALFILLSNPVKKVEDYLTSYYNNYTEDYGNEELVKIGDILKSHKDDEAKLESIEKQIKNTINNWVKNFNKSYADEEALKDEYAKIKGILDEIYSYFDGLEYVLSYEEYYNYYDELYSLYSSKSSYFNALSASDDYYKYYYYNEVISTDSYYEEAEEFVNNYLKDELDTLKEGAEELVNLGEDASNTQILEAYLAQLEYLKENYRQDDIDLSLTTDYQTLYDNAVSKIVEYTKLVAEELEENFETNDVMDIIDASLDVIDYDTDAYQELEELKASYENKMPSKLTDEYVVSYDRGTNYSSYGTTIEEIEYDSYISFRFDGETKALTFRLNNAYQTLKTTIVRGPNWDADFTGEIVIYGDDEELYRSSEITKTNEIDLEINLDVTDVDDLTIEFITESEPEDWANFYIYLVEPYLYK